MAFSSEAIVSKPVGKAAMIHRDRWLIHVDAIMLLRTTPKVEPEFFYYLSSTAQIPRSASAICCPARASRPRPACRVALKSPLHLPPLPEQTAIAEVLTEMDAELAALEQRREKTRALKQAMMQELLTGRTRLV